MRRSAILMSLNKKQTKPITPRPLNLITKQIFQTNQSFVTICFSFWFSSTNFLKSLTDSRCSLYLKRYSSAKEPGRHEPFLTVYSLRITRDKKRLAYAATIPLNLRKGVFLTMSGRVSKGSQKRCLFKGISFQKQQKKRLYALSMAFIVQMPQYSTAYFTLNFSGLRSISLCFFWRIVWIWQVAQMKYCEDSYLQSRPAFVFYQKQCLIDGCLKVQSIASIMSLSSFARGFATNDQVYSPGNMYTFLCVFSSKMIDLFPAKFPSLVYIRISSYYDTVFYSRPSSQGFQTQERFLIKIEVMSFHIPPLSWTKNKRCISDKSCAEGPLSVISSAFYFKNLKLCALYSVKQSNTVLSSTTITSHPLASAKCLMLLTQSQVNIWP